MKKSLLREVRLLRVNKEVHSFGQGVNKLLTSLLKDFSFLSVVYTFKMYGKETND